MANTGCIEKFEFKTTEGDHLLVVNGSITQGGGPYELRLSYTTKFGTGPTDPVREAQIIIFDDAGQQENYFETEPGLYLSLGNTVRGQEGSTYFIEIRTDENRVYRSRPETLPPLVQADSIYYELVTETSLNEIGNPVENKYIKVFVDTPVNKEGKDAWFRWRMIDTYTVTDLSCGSLDPATTCYITEEPNPQNIPVFSSEVSATDHLEKFQLSSNLFEPRYAYASQHYYNAFQYSISKAAHEYWEKISKIANQEGTIFDPPPATVRGNLFNVNDKNEIVLGYFEATAVDTIRTFSFKRDFPDVSIPAFCTFGDMPRNSGACCSCLLLDNSTLEMPSYWGE
jgi:hypothetical protein